MDPQVQVALIASLSSLAGVVVGAIPSYWIARAQHRMEIQRQQLGWRKDYREKLLARVEDVLSKRARGEQISPSLHMVGVFDGELAEIMSRIATVPTPNNELMVQAYKRMEELVGELRGGN